MTDKLPPQLLALFAPRPPLRYIPPQDREPESKASNPSAISGIAAFLPALDSYKVEDDYQPTESWLQRKDRLKQEKKERLENMAQENFTECEVSECCLTLVNTCCLLMDAMFTDDPANDAQIRGDAFKTLFVSRLHYDIKESDLEREFGRFGPIERVRST